MALLLCVVVLELYLMAQFAVFLGAFVLLCGKLGVKCFIELGSVFDLCFICLFFVSFIFITFCFC